MLPSVSEMVTAVVESVAPWEPLMTQSKLPLVTLLGYTAVDVVLATVVLHATCGVQIFNLQVAAASPSSSWVGIASRRQAEPTP